MAGWAMYALIVAFGTSFLFSLVITNWVRRWGRSWGLLDHADGYRKTHPVAVPRVGGIAILSASALTALGSLPLGGGLLLMHLHEFRELSGVALGAVGMFLLGLWDDLRRLRARFKLLVQVFIVLVVSALGLRINVLSFGGGEILALPLWASLPITTLWLVGITNSLNLVDGSDGVAGGAALFALSTMTVVLLLTGNELAAALCVVLAGATLGFLFFNFPPASIFLGDAGSLFLGFMLAATGMVATQKAPTLVAVVVPLIAFGVPVLDTGLAIVRRIMRRASLIEADRGHIHHRLRDLGHSPRAVVLLLYAAFALFSLLSLLLVGGSGRRVGALLLLTAVVTILMIQRLKIPEVLELGKLVPWGIPNRLVIERNLRVRRAVEQLEQTDTAEAILRALQAGFRDGEFCRMELALFPPFGDRFLRLSGVREKEGEVLFSETFFSPAREDLASTCELRLLLVDGHGEELGMLSLFLPVDGKRIGTDVTLIGRDLRKALSGAIVRSVAAAENYGTWVERSNERGDTRMVKLHEE